MAQHSRTADAMWQAQCRRSAIRWIQSKQGQCAAGSWLLTACLVSIVTTLLHWLNFSFIFSCASELHFRGSQAPSPRSLWQSLGADFGARVSAALSEPRPAWPGSGRARGPRWTPASAQETRARRTERGPREMRSLAPLVNQASTYFTGGPKRCSNPGRSLPARPSACPTTGLRKPSAP